MMFALICTDKPNSLEVRLATRAAHLAYLDGHAGKLLQAGPLLDAEGRPVGSLLLVEAADLAEVTAFAAADPYAQAGLFESTVIRPYRSIFAGGARAA